MEEESETRARNSTDICLVSEGIETRKEKKKRLAAATIVDGV
jgi:hypothetical protein